MTPEWKLKARAAMELKHIDDAEMGRLLKTSKSGIGKMLSDKQQSSALVVRMCEILEIDLPLVAPPEEPDELKVYVDGLQPELRTRALTLLKVAFDPDA